MTQVVSMLAMAPLVVALATTVGYAHRCGAMNMRMMDGHMKGMKHTM